VKLLFYAAAALPQNLWDALESLSIATVGHAVPMVSAWGATETAPLATDCHFQAQRSGNIGVPVPGTEIKLVPTGDKLEARCVARTSRRGTGKRRSRPRRRSMPTASI
jgi:feruloyl-CoA synthase